MDTHWRNNGEIKWKYRGNNALGKRRGNNVELAVSKCPCTQSPQRLPAYCLLLSLSASTSWVEVKLKPAMIFVLGAASCNRDVVLIKLVVKHREPGNAWADHEARGPGQETTLACL